MAENIQVKGIKELGIFMDALEGELGGLVAEGFIRGMAQPLLREIRATDAFEDRRNPGLRDSFRLRKAPRDYDADFYMAADPHWWLVEYGHGGPKPAPAHPFIEPALLSMQAQMEQAGFKRASSVLMRLAEQSKRGTLSKRNRRLAGIEE